jgi:hypothetical protein
MKITIWNYEITIERFDSKRRRLAEKIERIRAVDYPDRKEIKIVRVKIAWELMYNKQEGMLRLAKEFVESAFDYRGMGDIL